MRRIDNLTNDAKQQTNIVLDDGTVAQLRLTHLPAVQRWRLDVTAPKLVVQGLNLCTNPSVLRPWRYTAGFGLACLTSDGVDPIYIDDFSNGRAALYLLSMDELLQIEALLLGES